MSFYDLSAQHLFVDLDGVLADLDTHYERLYGVRPDRTQPDPPGFAENLAKSDFFLHLPPMPDAFELWEGIRHLRPTVLTGIPRLGADTAAAHKRAWVARHLGLDVRVVTCRASEKYLHGKPGDVLVDDWHKYQRRWERMGGHFILHTSAAESLRQVRDRIPFSTV